MRRPATAILAIILSVWCTKAEVLTLTDCQQKAVDNYPAIAQYGLIERTAQFSLSNAAKAWLPQGALSAQATWQNDVASLPDVLAAIMQQQGVSYPGMEKLQYRAGFDVSQQIWDGGRTSANRRAIGASTDVERRSMDVQMYDLEARVQDIYFAILLFDARIGRLDRSANLVDSTLRQVQAMYANGTAMRSDCDQIEAKLLSLKQQRAQLTASAESYRRILGIFTGEDVGSARLTLPEEVETIDRFSHPQLQLFDSRLDNLAAREASVKTSAMPSLGAFVSGYYGYPGYNMFKNMMTRDMSFNIMVGLKLSWNFGSLYTRGNDLAKIDAERGKVEADRQTFLFNNRIAMSESSGQIEALRAMIKDDERIVELRASVLRAARSQLRNGVIDTTTLLAKITDEELAADDMALHKIQLIQALYNLNHLRNK